MKTLSPSWNRVARLTPTLPLRVEVQRQVFRGEPWYVLHDPISNDFFRLNPICHHLVALLDGRRTVDEVWRITLDRFGDEAPTQNEVIGLLSQLYCSNLIRLECPPDAEALLARRRERRLRHWRGQAMSILFLRIGVFNPDRILRWLLPVFRPLLSKWGLGLWFVWICFSLWQFVPHMGSFVGEVNSILAPVNWPWMIVLFLITKLIHEMGHGLVCRRFGGNVPEIGIILLVLFPAPYVDATSSWNFPDKWKRLLVAAAGMIFELAVAAAAALVWLHAVENSLPRQLAYNMVFIASVSTLIFNGNPLLRFDGYYMLSDLLEIPNLYERAKQQLYWLAQRYGYGISDIAPIGSTRSERAVLTGYGIAATMYRFLVLFGIFIFIIGKLYVFGVLLAIWSAIAWVLVPLSKFVRWLVLAPVLHGHRPRAVAVTTVFAVIPIAILGLVPVKDNRRASGVVESGQSAEVVAQIDGFVIDVRVRPNEVVRQRQVLLLAENPDLQSQHEMLQAKLKDLRLEYRKAVKRGPNAQTAAQRILVYHEQDLLVELQRQIDALTIRSPHDGIIVGDLASLTGQYLKRGQVIAMVLSADDLRVTTLVGQEHNAPLFDGQAIADVRLRTAGMPHREMSSAIFKRFHAARTKLPHPALGYRGGGRIATDPADSEGRTMLQPHFELWLRLPPARLEREIRPLPGQRVHIRFTLGRRRPLLLLWTHRLRQVIRRRVSI